NSISAYAIDSRSGALTAISARPYPAEASPTSVAMHPSGKFLYVTNSESNTISAYSIDGMTGQLQAIAAAPFANGGSAGYLAAIEPLAPVDREATAGHVCRAVAEEEHGGVRNLARGAEPLQRHAVLRHLGELWVGHQPAERAFRGHRSWRDRIHANAVRRPLDCERARQGENARFRACRWQHERGARPCVRGDDVDDGAFSSGDHLLPERAGAVERAVEHNVDHRLESVRREIFGGGEEVARRVVHQPVRAGDLRRGALDGG